tara:strand:- start:8249 stop:9403 length:1155 start_codon:yes stop_codon:yes gene_type:complete
MATVPRFTGKGLYKTGVSNQRLVLNNANRLLNRHLLRRQFIKVSDDTKLDFSDVLITPRRSSLKSRSEAVLEREVYFVNSGQKWKGVPIAVSNMDTTGTIEMARELQKSKMLTCLHKYYSHQDIPDDLDTDYFAISTGISEGDLMKLDETLTVLSDIKFICIDVANGYMDTFVSTCKALREKYPDKIIIAGNVVTPSQVKRLLLKAKVDIVKIGIGSGSVCTTRLKTGVGYPQLSAILECHRICRKLGGYLMSDGGIQNPGDLAKAFGAGADFVMCGSVFAGHIESGGEIKEEEGVLYKIFYGMSSKRAMETHSGVMNSYRAEEGKVVKLKLRGHVNDTINDYLGGLRSTMTYVGAKTLKSLYNKTRFIRVNNQVNKIYNGKEL